MSEKVLGVIECERYPPWTQVDEAWFVTPKRVIVARLPRIKSGSPIYADSIADLFFVALDLISREPPGKSYRKKLVSLKSLNPDEILKGDEHNFAIPNSEITKIELKYGRWSVRAELNITTSNRKCQCFLKRIPSKAEKKCRAEHCENLLQPVFRDKLSVKK